MALILWLVLLVPSLAQAAIVFQEDWEGTDAQVLANWPATSCGAAWPRTSNPGISTTFAFSGTHSMHGHYQGHQQSHIDAGQTTGFLDSTLWGGCAGDYSIAPPLQEAWFTFYELLKGYTPQAGFFVDEIGTKDLIYIHGQVGGSFTASYVPTYMFGSLGNMQMDGAGAYDGLSNEHNNGAFTPLNDHWVCYEWHIKINDPGVANGGYELYATDMTAGGPTIQWMANLGRQLVGPTTGSSPPSNTRLGTMQMYVQDGWGDIYQDKHTISTTRLGCTGGPPPDTTAPTPPTASVTGTTGASMTVAWSGSTDAVGVTGYRLDASISNVFASFLPGFQNLDVGNVASKVIAGLAGSTTYYSRIRAYDAAGNISVNSNTVSGTTTTVPVSPTITSFVTDAAGFNETHTGTLGSYHLRYGDNAATFLIDIPLTLAQVVGGRYNITWPAATQWACLDPYDGGGVLNAAGTLCNTVTPGDVTAPAAPTGLTIAALAALLLLGGTYAHVARTAVSQSGLRPGLPDVDATTLRTVALHGSADGGAAQYAVVLDPGAAPAPARRLAPGPVDSPVADATSDEAQIDREG